MKKNKIGYWILTIIFAGMMTLSSVMYLTHQPAILQALHGLGYPDYILSLLGTAKIIGVISLLQTRYSTLKEWAYAGFSINLVAAAWSHLAVSENVAMPLILFLVLGGSYFFWKKIKLSAKETAGSQAGRFALKY